MNDWKIKWHEREERIWDIKNISGIKFGKSNNLKTIKNSAGNEIWTKDRSTANPCIL